LKLLTQLSQALLASVVEVSGKSENVKHVKLELGAHWQKRKAQDDRREDRPEGTRHVFN